MTDFTEQINLELIDFDEPNWHDKAWDNYRLIDAACALIGITLSGVWANSTAVVAGQFYVDGITGLVWKVIVSHTTSASPTTFLADRTSNPSYWETVNQLGAWQGAWQATTYYAASNVVYNGSVYYRCHTSHTSGGTFSASNWDTIADFSIALGLAEDWAEKAEDSEVTAGQYSALHWAAKAAASASTFEFVEEQIDGSDAKATPLATDLVGIVDKADSDSLKKVTFTQFGAVIGSYLTVVSLGDNQNVNIGAGNDLLLYHNATNSFIDNATGNVSLRQLVHGGSGYLIAEDNGGVARNCIVWGGANGNVQLGYGANTVVTTTSSGIEVVGEIEITNAFGETMTLAFEDGTENAAFEITYGGVGAASLSIADDGNVTVNGTLTVTG